jgi:hypothetical protein
LRFHLMIPSSIGRLTTCGMTAVVGEHRLTGGGP